MTLERLAEWVRNVTLLCLALLALLPLLALARLTSWSVSELAHILSHDLATAFSWPYWLAPTAGLGALVLAGMTSALARRVRPGLRERRFTSAEAASQRLILDEIDERLRFLVDRTEPNIVAAVEEVLTGALILEASDVHLTPSERGLEITYRVDGELVLASLQALSTGAMFATRVKVLARLDPALRRRTQDGRLDTSVAGQRLSARVSTLPSEHGERVVLRLVAGSRRLPSLGRLGLTRPLEQRLAALLEKPQGLLLVTGPVGSGKTTTLYSALQHIHRHRQGGAAIVTLEDPVEQRLAFATQTQIQRKGGVDFAAALRGVLRQDPNVLMVGEIRDRETAEIAMQAGLTGHLILTTVHGHGAAGAFARLQEMGVEGYLLSSATLGALAQRLVKRLCPACKRPAAPDEAERVAFEAAGLGAELAQGGAAYHEAHGCSLCDDSGFDGRMPIAELLVMSSELGEALMHRPTTQQLREIARREGMTSLLEDGLRLARRGDTTLAEVLRVVG